jgi:stage V sporulation protein AB
MIGLGILTRFIGVTHTADRIALYEDAVFAGAAVGTVATTFDIGTGGILPGIVSSALLVMSGLFMGMFVGGWIMALAEIINVFPVFCRRFGIVKGMSWIVIALAAGKVTGSLYHFYMRWGKG